ncbi:MAG: hypothetical protein Fues2KO_53430 [Fuerstiella sp.]
MRSVATGIATAAKPASSDAFDAKDLRRPGGAVRLLRVDARLQFGLQQTIMAERTGSSQSEPHTGLLPFLLTRRSQAGSDVLSTRNRHSQSQHFV